MNIVLNAAEARVLGSLIEKDITTPDYYPLSLNALINACNQKNNREPVTNFDEETVRLALRNLSDKRARGIGIEEGVNHKYAVIADDDAGVGTGLVLRSVDRGVDAGPDLLEDERERRRWLRQRRHAKRSKDGEGGD